MKSPSPIDQDAMRRSIKTVRQRDRASADHIDAMMRDDDDASFEGAGRFASASCQARALHLKPWQTIPLWVGDIEAALAEPYGDQRGDREAAEILQKLLSLGLSRFEPSPLDAIAAAERGAAS